MKIKKIILILILIYLLVNVIDSDMITSQYDDLEIKSNLSLKKKDLPNEFDDEALKIVNDFIKKTHNLNREWAIYFDYTAGEILKVGYGEKNNVKITFRKKEFEGCHVVYS